MTDEKLYWHFLAANRKLGYGDDRTVKVGETLTVKGKPVLCERGLHASERTIDALRYSSGPIICRVRLGGVVIEGGDKVAATERTVLAWADATELLHEFACWCAERALAAAKVTDPRCFAAIEAKRKWLRKELSDDELSAARSAAWSAARSAAWSAARGAERGAAWSAESAAARSAAWSAARSAERGAAESAAWSAAESAENTELEKQLTLLLAANEAALGGGK